MGITLLYQPEFTYIPAYAKLETEMKKISLLSLFCVALIFSSVAAIGNPRSVGATSHCGNWRVTTDPTSITPGTRTINVGIQTFGLVTGDTYTVILRNARINPVNITNPSTTLSLPRDVEVARVPVGSDGKITINNLNVYGETNNANPIDSFGGGNYSLEIRDPSGNSQCTVGFTAQQIPLQQLCTVNFTNSRFSPNDDIMVNVSPIEGTHRIKLERVGGGRRSANCYDASSGSLSANLGRAEVGAWRVIVMNSCSAEELEINQCVSQDFRVTPDGSGGGPSGSPVSITPVNTQGRCTAGQIDTAVGCIPYNDVNSFAAWFLKWAIGIAGGIAFLMIIFSGFQIMTSSNNPQQLQTGRELLTAAVSGLILIIFSAFLLKLIGVDILGIPGLASP